MLTPSQVNAANNAFNIAANIFPGGASWKDIQNGDFWKKNKCYQYFKMERRKFIAAFKNDKQGQFDTVGTDAILGGMSINDDKGYVEITMNTDNGIETYRYDSNNMLDGMSLIPANEEYSIKQTNDKLQPSLALVDENGDIIKVHATYDPASKGGNSPDGRKVKGTIHWVDQATAFKAPVRLYENVIDEEKGVYNEDGSLNLNPHSLTGKDAYIEASVKDAKPYDSFQFVRNGFFCVDAKDSKEGALVFNRIVSLKSSFKLPNK